MFYYDVHVRAFDDTIASVDANGINDIIETLGQVVTVVTLEEHKRFILYRRRLVSLHSFRTSTTFIK